MMEGFVCASLQSWGERGGRVLRDKQRAHNNTVLFFFWCRQSRHRHAVCCVVSFGRT